MKYPKKISEETLHENPWWTYKHDILEQPDGESTDYYYGESKGSVIIIPIRDDGRFILTRQYRYLAEKFSFEFPGGSVVAGEEEMTAARRELYEETGGIADELIYVGSFYPINGMIKEEMGVYIAHIGEQQEQHLETGEDIELLYRRPDEFIEMIRNQDISCGQTLAAWALAQNYFSKTPSTEASPGFAILFDFFLNK